VSFKLTPLMNNLIEEANLIVDIAISRFSNIAVLFSGGKDSTVLAEIVDQRAKLSKKNYDLVHIDTGCNFKEMLNFIQNWSEKKNKKIIRSEVDTSLPLDQRNRAQSLALKKIISEKEYDIVFVGARRDEDKSRQKETIFSKRKNNGGWLTDNIQFEFPHHYHLEKDKGEHFRVHPISNWTELDVWTYIGIYNIPVCPIYYSHYSESSDTGHRVRYRTVGDQTNSHALISSANDPYSVAMENIRMGDKERSGRQDDNFSEYSMEIRKKEGYF
jgi:sulfate adenylyltransferase subunit 2